MIRFGNGIWLILLLSLVASCSTKPKKNYQVTTLQSISYSLLDLADRKRQLQQYEQALLLYREAESYALQRNDKYTIGLSQLKRAAIRIQLQQPKLALELIGDVERMVKFENVELAHPLMYIQAQYAKLTGEGATALRLLNQLQAHYQQDPEKLGYYRFVAWSYQHDAVAIDQIEADLNLLTRLKAERKLANIEIYSYAIFHYLNYLVAKDDDRAEGVIKIALAHFSEVELSNKIIECYQLASRFYEKRQLSEKAMYFRQQAARLAQVLN